MTGRIDPAHIPEHLAAAGKLLDRAIEMFFSGDDLLFVLAMGNPAHVLLHDIADERSPGGNVMSQVAARVIKQGALLADGSPVTKIGDVMTVVRRDANGLKHPKEKPGVRVESIDTTLTVACIDAVSLSVASPTQLVYLSWRLAQDPDQPDHIRDFAGAMFPEVASMDFSEALSVGNAALENDQIVSKMLQLSSLILGSDGTTGD